MKIGIDATFIGTEKPTGLAVYTRQVVNELAKIHDDIVLWTTAESGFNLPQERVRNVLREFAFLGQNRYMVRPFWMEFLFSNQLRYEGVDVLYSTVPGGMRNCPVPHVVTVHDLTPIVFPEDHPWFVRWNYMKRLPKILSRSAAIIADSEHTKRDIVGYYGLQPDHINVVDLGYDPDIFRPVNDELIISKYGLIREDYVIAVGSANRRKNLDTLIVAFSHLRGQISHKLVLAGSISPSQELLLREVARKHNVEDRLIFPGYIPDSDLPAIYSGATLLAYISLYEGFGLPLLEAMACGVPVIASNSTSIPEVAGNAAILVDPLDYNAISRAILKVATDSPTKEYLQRAGLERASEFSWGKTAKSVYELLLGTYCENKN
ncbi:MAG: glycosyltransferase family 4 protein [Geobacteraceae bacterium]|nr:glycosyltransferase family 4 protein [Geobacteraceae bacterium]